jgi:hypothetical protein
MEDAHSYLKEPITRVIMSILRGEVHTASVGEIVEVHGMSAPPGALPGEPFEASPTVDVQLSYKRKFSGEEPTNLPPLLNLPVVILGGSDWWVTPPISKGDEVLVIASERSLDEWKAAGGSNEILNGRGFDLTDALVILCPRNDTKNKVLAVAGGVCIGKADGSVFIHATEEKAALTVSGARLELVGGKVRATPVLPSVTPVDVFVVATPAGPGGLPPALGVSLLNHKHGPPGSIPVPEPEV